MADANELKALRDEIKQLRESDAKTRAELTRVADRQAIFEVVNTYSRGVDRHDVDIMNKAYWPDALDDRGNFVGTGAEFPDWVNERHASAFTIHTHHITNHHCELMGDKANTETYVMYVLPHKSGTMINFGSARYIDRMEKRNGEWRIALRRIVFDWRFQASTKIDPATWPTNYTGKRESGAWDKTDLSYSNPRAVSAEGKKMLEARGVKV